MDQESRAATPSLRSRRSSTDEFKAGAICLVLDERKTIRQAAGDLDLTQSALSSRTCLRSFASFSRSGVVRPGIRGEAGGVVNLFTEPDQAHERVAARHARLAASRQQKRVRPCCALTVRAITRRRRRTQRRRYTFARTRGADTVCSPRGA
jgi:transposase-like protein